MIVWGGAIASIFSLLAPAGDTAPNLVPHHRQLHVYSEPISQRNAYGYFNANSNSYGYSHSQSNTDRNANRNPYWNTDNDSNAE